MIFFVYFQTIDKKFWECSIYINENIFFYIQFWREFF